MTDLVRIEDIERAI